MSMSKRRGRLGYQFPQTIRVVSDNELTSRAGWSLLFQEQEGRRLGCQLPHYLTFCVVSAQQARDTYILNSILLLD